MCMYVVRHPQQQQASMSTSGVTGGSLPHSLHPSHQHIRGNAAVAVAGLRHDQHHGGPGQQQVSQLLHVDGLHQLDPSQQMEKSMAHIEQLANNGGTGGSVMITTANTASPPNHIRNMLLSQHHQQSSKSAVITGGNPVLMGHQHQSSAQPPPGHSNVHTSPMGTMGEMHPGLSARSLGGEHPHSSNTSGPGGILHPTTPMSPVTPPPDNPSSVHSYGGWPANPYPQHHALLIGNESYAHSLPLLPPMQANTPTTQNHAFFKANF